MGAQPEIYLPFLQSPSNTVTLVARTTTEPRAFTAAVRREVANIDHALPVSNIKFMDEIVAGTVAQPRLYALLIGIFAGLALLLAAMGIYGVMSYSVVQRTHEIGVRMALGAQRRDVMKLIVKQGMWLALVAIAIGLVLAFATTRVIQSLLFGVSSTDPVTFIGIPLLLALVMMIACYLPARKATKVDPLVAMRYE